jgi:hypothetical protein
MLRPAVATSGAEVLVEVGDRLAEPGVVDGHGGPAGGRIAQGVQDGHALGGAEDQVERWHRPLAVGAAQQLAGPLTAKHASSDVSTGNRTRIPPFPRPTPARTGTANASHHRIEYLFKKAD